MFIVIDCGHAKNTAGKYSPKLEDGTRFYEYEYNRKIGKRLGERLTELGIDWCFTYDIDNEEDISLTSRANVANEKAKIYGYRNVLLISIHHNALGCGDEWYDAEGFSVWTTNGETISDRYALALIRTAKEVLEPKGIKVRGEYEKNFTIIYKTICPSILVEYGFFTNKKEVKWLMSEEGIEANVEATIKMIEKMC